MLKKEAVDCFRFRKPEITWIIRRFRLRISGVPSLELIRVDEISCNVGNTLTFNLHLELLV
jgi:hypothetical protein